MHSWVMTNVTCYLTQSGRLEHLRMSHEHLFVAFPQVTTGSPIFCKNTFILFRLCQSIKRTWCNECQIELFLHGHNCELILTLRSKLDRLTVSSSFSLRFLFCGEIRDALFQKSSKVDKKSIARHVLWNCVYPRVHQCSTHYVLA